MDNSEIVKDFIELVRSEAAIIALYDLLLEKTTNRIIKEKAIIFQQDHKRHIQVLLDILNNADISNPVILGEIKIEKIEKEGFDESNIVNELLIKEENISSVYRKIIDLEIDFKTEDILDYNLEDELLHTSFFQNVIRDYHY